MRAVTRSGMGLQYRPLEPPAESLAESTVMSAAVSPTWLESLSWYLSEVGRMAFFSARVLRRGFSQRPNGAAVLEECFRAGVQTLPVLLLVSAFIGSSMALQGYHAFKPLGGQSLVGMFVAVAGIRELAPLIATTIIAAKTGTEMCTTLAIMRNTEQIDALEVMGINPYAYLVTPRLLAITLILPLLTILADFVCFVSGYLVAVTQLEVDPGAFLDTALQYVGLADIFKSVLKASVFGVIIGMLACYFGFNTERGPLGVGRAANKAIVLMVIACTISNYLLSEALYG